jgi:signal transduction histidine kinase
MEDNMNGTFADTARGMYARAKELLSAEARLRWAAVVAAVGLLEIMALFGSSWIHSAERALTLIMFVAALVAVVWIDERRYWLAYFVAVGAAFIQLLFGLPFMFTELCVAVVFYRIAYHAERPFARWVSLVSTVPAAALVVEVMLHGGTHIGAGMYRPNLFAGLVVLAVFGGAWLLGYSRRLKSAADESRSAQVDAEAERDVATAERDVAAEVARLKEAQAALARDVHDVVGHSLAVILAQAESAEYLPDDDVPALRAAVDAIKGSARSALGEVRTVLSATQSSAESAPPGDVRQLIESTRKSGCDVVMEEIGQQVDISADENAVAYRVLQELLTNAIRHGMRDGTIRVVREWLPGELRIEVTNQYEPGDPATCRDGHGLMGIRQRLTRMGGRLDVVRRDEADGHRFIARVSILLAEGGAHV